MTMIELDCVCACGVLILFDFPILQTGLDLSWLVLIDSCLLAEFHCFILKKIYELLLSIKQTFALYTLRTTLCVGILVYHVNYVFGNLSNVISIVEISFPVLYVWIAFYTADATVVENSIEKYQKITVFGPHTNIWRREKKIKSRISTFHIKWIKKWEK